MCGRLDARSCRAWRRVILAVQSPCGSAWPLVQARTVPRICRFCQWLRLAATELSCVVFKDRSTHADQSLLAANVMIFAVRDLRTVMEVCRGAAGQRRVTCDRLSSQVWRRRCFARAVFPHGASETIGVWQCVRRGDCRRHLACMSVTLGPYDNAPAQSAAATASRALCFK